MSLWLAVTRNDIADYVNTLVLVYLVLIFIRIILSWIPRVPYNRFLNGFVATFVLIILGGIVESLIRG